MRPKKNHLEVSKSVNALHRVTCGSRLWVWCLTHIVPTNGGWVPLVGGTNGRGLGNTTCQDNPTATAKRKRCQKNWLDLPRKEKKKKNKEKYKYCFLFPYTSIWVQPSLNLELWKYILQLEHIRKSIRVIGIYSYGVSTYGNR